MTNFSKKISFNEFLRNNLEKFENVNKYKRCMNEKISHCLLFQYLLRLQNRNCDYLLAIFFLALPPILGLIYIKIFGVNVVYWDQWALVPLIEKTYTGSLTLGDLFSQHNEHRIFFPRIIMLILAYATHYNNVAEMYFSWILSFVTMLLILKMYLQDFGNSISSLIKFVPVAWLLFNFRQYENILWGWQIQIYLCVLGFVTSIYMFEKTKEMDKNFLLAIFSGIISSFSFLNGLIVWPVGLIYLLLTKKMKGNLPLVWVVTGFLVWSIYLYNWTKPQSHPSLFYIINNSVSSLTYFFVNVGSPLSFEKSNAFGNGLLIFTLMLSTFVIIEKQKLVENAKWVSFILFSLFSSLSLTIGRSGFGVEQALSSRYVTLTLLGIIGIYLIFSTLDSRFNKENCKIYSILYGIVLSLILVGIIVGYTEGMVEGKNILDSRELAKSYLIDYNKLISGTYLTLTFPDPDFVLDHVKILEKYHLNVFY